MMGIALLVSVAIIFVCIFGWLSSLTASLQDVEGRLDVVYENLHAMSADIKVIQKEFRELRRELADIREEIDASTNLVE